MSGPGAPDRPVTARAVVAPTLTDPLARTLCEVVGGPRGRRALHRSGWWMPVRVLVALVLMTMALGWAQKGYCRSTGFAGQGPFVHACYSDIPVLYQARGLAAGDVPYVAPRSVQPVEYPVLTGLVMWANARLVPAGVRDPGVWYFDITALGLALAAVVAVVSTIGVAGRRPWDVAMLAVAPTLALAGTVNWDLWAVMLTSLSMLAWARRRPWLAGVLLGLGTATKFYPVLLLGALIVLGLRTGRMRAVGQAVAAAVVSWLVVNLPVAVASFRQWSTFYRFSQARGVDFGSPWYAAQLVHHGLPPGLVNLVPAGSFAVACLAIAVLVLHAPRRARLAQVAFLVLAAFLLTTKVYSPQYVLWLLPLAVLARPRWRDFLIWQAGEVVYFFAVWLYIDGFSSPQRGLPVDWYVAATAVHLLATGWLVAMVVRDLWSSRYDAVRADGTDDPAGGVFDGAPDWFVLRRRPVHRAGPVGVGATGGNPGHQAG
ncbi:MAG: glycosyltransferase family 87 protein [Actinomycetes bacterium]